jgi:hypothetical protein
MRVPVVDARGIPLMPCTPPTARALLKAGNACPKRTKLGLFYLQLTYVQEPSNQRLVVGIDPGSSFEGCSVVGTSDTVCSLMSETPTQVKYAVQTRRSMRRARRRRLWRRPCRLHNRLAGNHWIAPSTRSRWEAKARIVRQLATILPLSDAAVEHVHAVSRRGEGRQWNAAFRPVQVGKEHLNHLLKQQGLTVYRYTGSVTKQLRESFGLTKTHDKAARTFSSHAVDAWVLAAATSGATAPTCTRLWYVVPFLLHRRQLRRLQADREGVWKPYGGTRSLGLTRGTLVRHPRSGLCTVGGYDRKKQRLSLHAYRTNTRLTQGAKPADCRRLTAVAFRTWCVPLKQAAKQREAVRPPQGSSPGSPRRLRDDDGTCTR